MDLSNNTAAVCHGRQPRLCTDRLGTVFAEPIKATAPHLHNMVLAGLTVQNTAKDAIGEQEARGRLWRRRCMPYNRRPSIGGILGQEPVALALHGLH